MSPRTGEPADPRTPLLPLLHVCDSLFPIGGFAYSDGLEAAAKHMATAADLHEWIVACVDETFARLEGPAVARAWTACRDRDVDALGEIDREVIAMRPSGAARSSARAMGMRLISTWQALHPDETLVLLLARAHEGRLAPALPVAFGAVCAASGVDRRDAVQAYGYTRLAATTSAAMRTMAIGQMEAHRLLARALDRLPPIVDAIERSPAPLACFTPLMDIAAMTQQYLESRLFRS